MADKKELPPLTEVIKKGHRVRVYLMDTKNSTTYTHGIASGNFNMDGMPILNPVQPVTTPDYYLHDSKVRFNAVPSSDCVICRPINKA